LRVEVTGQGLCTLLWSQWLLWLPWLPWSSSMQRSLTPDTSEVTDTIHKSQRSGNKLPYPPLQGGPKNQQANLAD
jgi:hypothetical protein